MTVHPIATEEARFGAEAHLRYGGGGDDLAENVLALLDALTAAGHRATRAEAQSAIRGRAVVMYRERAREAEARIKAVQDVLELHGPAHDEPGHGEADCGPQIIADTRRALEG